MRGNTRDLPIEEMQQPDLAEHRFQFLRPLLLTLCPLLLTLQFLHARAPRVLHERHRLHCTGQDTGTADDPIDDITVSTNFDRQYPYGKPELLLDAYRRLKNSSSPL